MYNLPLSPLIACAVPRRFLVAGRFLIGTIKNWVVKNPPAAKRSPCGVWQSWRRDKKTRFGGFFTVGADGADRDGSLIVAVLIQSRRSRHLGRSYSAPRPRRATGPAWRARVAPPLMPPPDAAPIFPYRPLTGDLWQELTNSYRLPSVPKISSKFFGYGESVSESDSNLAGLTHASARRQFRTYWRGLVSIASFRAGTLKKFRRCGFPWPASATLQMRP